MREILSNPCSKCPFQFRSRRGVVKLTAVHWSKKCVRMQSIDVIRTSSLNRNDTHATSIRDEKVQWCGIIDQMRLLSHQNNIQ